MEFPWHKTLREEEASERGPWQRKPWERGSWERERWYSRWRANKSYKNKPWAVSAAWKFDSEQPRLSQTSLHMVTLHIWAVYIILWTLLQWLRTRTLSSIKFNLCLDTSHAKCLLIYWLKLQLRFGSELLMRLVFGAGKLWEVSQPKQGSNVATTKSFKTFCFCRPLTYFDKERNIDQFMFSRNWLKELRRFRLKLASCLQIFFSKIPIHCYMESSRPKKRPRGGLRQRLKRSNEGIEENNDVTSALALLLLSLFAWGFSHRKEYNR